MNSTPFSFIYKGKLTSGRKFTPSALALYIERNGEQSLIGHELAFTENNAPCALILSSIRVVPTHARQTPIIHVQGFNGANQPTQHTITAPNEIYLFDQEQVQL